MGITVDINLNWVDFLAVLQNNLDTHKRHVSFIAAQAFAYHIWKERNHRMQNAEFLDISRVLIPREFSENSFFIISTPILV